jgi:two-component system sensor histidine kinase DesK
LLAAGLAALGGPAIMYVMTVGAFAATVLAPRVSIVALAVVTASVALIDVVSSSRAQVVFTDSAVAFVVGLFAFGVTRLAETNLELAAAREEVARLAVADERLRFARDLHDLLGHTLSVIRVKAELASRLAEPDSPASREMHEVEAVARQALAEVRETVTGYRRASLASEIANARLTLATAGIEAELTADDLNVPSAVDAALGWVLREAVANVVRHSHASRCHIDAALEDGVARLEVADDGRGPVADDTPGYGLAGIRERLAQVGGTVELGRSAQGGFRVLAHVPRTT